MPETGTVTAARQIGKGLQVLIEAEVCSGFEAIQAALAATPEGATPERYAILEELRKET